MKTKLQALVAAATLGVASGGPFALAQPASSPSEAQQPAMSAAVKKRAYPARPFLGVVEF